MHLTLPIDFFVKRVRLKLEEYDSRYKIGLIQNNFRGMTERNGCEYR